MPIPITMPRKSDTMTEGTLIKWRVKVGDKVRSGDILADIETDKATMEMETFDDGTVAWLGVQEGQATSVGQVVLVLAQAGESIEAAAGSAQGGASQGAAAQGAAAPATSKKKAGSGGEAQASPPAAAPATPVASAAAAAADASGRVRASPLAKKVAQDVGVDLRGVVGTGPAGRIIRKDVEEAAQKPAAREAASAAPGKPVARAEVRAEPRTESGYALPAPQPLEARTLPLTSKRKTIARRLLESKQGVPHFTVTMTLDAQPVLALRQQLNAALASEGVKLSVNDFVVKAAAAALVRHPMINAAWSDEGIVTHAAVNIGVAVAIPLEQGGGLVVPTLRDCHTRSIRAISEDTRRLASKARKEGLSLEEMSGGTFTISNLGMFGVDHFEAIINPPQAAILAVGAALERPVVRNGQVVAGTTMSCTLSCDHRVIDGAMAAEFLQTLQYVLEHPAISLV